jgi:hypothetical protein
MVTKLNRVSENCMIIIWLNSDNNRVSGEAEQSSKSSKGNNGWKTS